MKATVPSVPRQSGVVKISKLGMLWPVPPSHCRVGPTVNWRSIPSPSTCRRSIWSLFSRCLMRLISLNTSRQRLIGLGSSRKHASMIWPQYFSCESRASLAIAGVP